MDLIAKLIVVMWFFFCSVVRVLDSRTALGISIRMMELNERFVKNLFYNNRYISQYQSRAFLLNFIFIFYFWRVYLFSVSVRLFRDYLTLQICKPKFSQNAIHHF